MCIKRALCAFAQESAALELSPVPCLVLGRDLMTGSYAPMALCSGEHFTARHPPTRMTPDYNAEPQMPVCVWVGVCVCVRV